MPYSTYNYSNYGRGVGHGITFSKRSYSNPINLYNWIVSDSYIYSEQELFNPYLNELIEVVGAIYGSFVYSSYDGSLNEEESTASRLVYTDKYGLISVDFSEPYVYSSITDIDNWQLANGDSNIFGSNYDDQLYGDGGNDNFNGWQGNDLIDGGDGTDIVFYSAPKSGYSLKLTSQYQLLIRDIDPSDGDDGTDRLTGIESVNFGSNINPINIENLRSEALFNTPANISNSVNRLLNISTGKHLFSANKTEMDYLTGGGYGWVDEGTSYLTPSNSTAEVYRFLISDEGRHFYTANKNERDLIRSNLSNFIYEGIAYEVYSVDDHPADATAVVRYYNSSINSHVYSTSGYEQMLLNQNPQWINEGIAWYGEAAI